jgi:hypothetical protein
MKLRGGLYTYTYKGEREGVEYTEEGILTKQTHNAIYFKKGKWLMSVPKSIIINLYKVELNKDKERFIAQKIYENGVLLNE